MANLVWPDPLELERAGYQSVAKVPVLFDNEWCYLNELNWYLRQRARVEWSPASGSQMSIAKRRYPTKRTLEQFARDLGNFSDWLSHRGFDWRLVDYSTHLVDGYQADMQEGRWGTTGKGLDPSTINGRMGEACNFLRWCGERGLREPFEMVVSTHLVHRPVATNSHGHQAVAVTSRVGGIRLNPKVLRLPTVTEVDRWLGAVKLQRGGTKALVCELILEGAIRLSEAAEWRVDTLPVDPAHWHIVGDNVQVTVKYGAKGPKYRDEFGNEYGPPRAIFIPLAFAHRLHKYRETRRLAAVAKWIKSATNSRERARRRREQPVHLFLSEHLGVPVTRGAIYQAWTEVGHQPFKGWSPHGGRHLWACRKLLAGLERNARIAGRSLADMPGDWVTGQSQTDLDIIIRPQLGHMSRETTLRYLQWVHAAAVLPDVADSYLRFLEGGNG